MRAILKKKVNAKVAVYLHQKVNVYGVGDANSMTALPKKNYLIVESVMIFHAQNWLKRTKMKIPMAMALRLKT